MTAICCLFFVFFVCVHVFSLFCKYYQLKKRAFEFIIEWNSMVLLNAWEVFVHVADLMQLWIGSCLVWAELSLYAGSFLSLSCMCSRTPLTICSWGSGAQGYEAKGTAWRRGSLYTHTGLHKKCLHRTIRDNLLSYHTKHRAIEFQPYCRALVLSASVIPFLDQHS